MGENTEKTLQDTMKEVKKEKRRDISKTVGIALEFMFLIMAVGMFLPKLIGLGSDTGNIAMCIVATGILYFQCRSRLPEGWPVKSGSKCSIGTFLTALGVVSLLQFLTSLPGTDNKEAVESTALYTVYMGFLIPICEEFVFRGFVMERFRKYGAVFAIVGSAFLFGLYHCNVIQLVTGTLMGIMFGYVAMKYSILYTILLHMINNGLYAILLKKASDALSMPALNSVIPAVFVVVGLIAFIREKPVKKIKEYLSEHPTEKGTFKYLFLNGWFIAIIAAVVIGTIFILSVVAPSMANGQMQP